MNHHLLEWRTSTRKYVYTVTSIALGILIFFSQIVPSQGQVVDTLSQGQGIDPNQPVDVAAGKTNIGLSGVPTCGEEYGQEYYNPFSAMFRRPPYETLLCDKDTNPHDISRVVDGNWNTYWQSTNVTSMEKYWEAREGRKARKVRITLDLEQVHHFLQFYTNNWFSTVGNYK